MDLVKEVLMLALLHKRIYKKKRRHRYWVQLSLCTRLEPGQFYTLFYELRKEENELFQYFRMSLKSFDGLLSLLQEEICGLETNMRRCVLLAERLATVDLGYTSLGYNGLRL
jgi:hypothetical protein